MDLSKLTPAPWEADAEGNLFHPFTKDGAGWRASLASFGLVVGCGADEEETANVAFVVLARNAFDIMMRRHWNAHWDGEKFRLDCRDRGFGGYDENDWRPGNFEEWCQDNGFDDPFTALCAAEEWYVANAEKK